MDNAPKTLIEIKNLYKIFGRKPKSVLPLIEKNQSKETILADTGHTVGLVDINMTINEGELFVIMGLSGSGKSTLIRHINRLIDPTVGEIIINDTNILDLSLPKLRAFRRERLSMVFQRFALMPHKTVLENVGYGLKIKGIKAKERFKIATKWMGIVGLEGYEKQYPSQLSGGQQQRVGLARALATDADILLMDEAFSALDPLIRSEMQEQLIALQHKFHKTIVFITHDLDEALRLGDRIAILKDGKLIQVGKPVDILMHPKDDYVKAFVKDVNRARALPVETLTTTVDNIVGNENIVKTLKKMSDWNRNYAYYCNHEGYQGIVYKSELESLNDKENKLCENHYSKVDAVINNASIETVLAQSLESQNALAVINHRNELVGELKNKSLIDFFNHHF